MLNISKTEKVDQYKPLEIARQSIKEEALGGASFALELHLDQLNVATLFSIPHWRLTLPNFAHVLYSTLSNRLQLL